MIPVFLPLFCLFFYFSPAMACRPSQDQLEKQKIQFLLQEIEQIQAVFIRNGQEYGPPVARRHLENKLQQAQKRFWFFSSSKPLPVMDFIDQIASRSSVSGKAYQIKFPDGRIVSTGNWLKEKLKEFKPAPLLKCRP